MDFLLFALGSAGDVHPFVGLGRALQAHGHRARIASSDYWQPLVERAGLGFASLASREEYLELASDPNIWHPLFGFQTIVARGVVPGLGRVYDLAARFHAEEQGVVIASSLALGARVAQERLGVPVISAHLQPSMFLSLDAPPKIGGQLVPRWFPRSLLRLQRWAAERLYVDRVLGQPLNQFRAENGLPPVQRVISQWVHSPLGVLGLFPAWYAPPQRDWPPGVELTGFPLYDEEGATPLAPAMNEFLAAGSPPIVFTPGSAMVHGHTFFEAAVEACQMVGRRGLLLTRFSEQIPPNLPPDVRHFDFAPFGRLLPRAAAVVHHGGVGTLSQALAAGIPQVIMPMSHDQPDNADRASRLGVAVELSPQRFSAKSLAQALRRQLEAPAVRARCNELAARIGGENGLQQACDAVERLAFRAAGRDGARSGALV